jgi:hypothetical protein
VEDFDVYGEDNIKIDLKEIVSRCMGCNYLAQDRDCCRLF